MNEQKFTIKCPTCGEELTFSVKVNGENGLNRKEVERLAALKAQGIDTTGCFAIAAPDGKAKHCDGLPSEKDPIGERINENGTIPERRLFRRWVMAQMFRHLESGDYTRSVRNLGYEYCWRQTLEELRVQSVLHKHGDMENFKARNKWFNKEAVTEMCEEYVAELRKYVDSRKVKCCKGKPYKVIAGENVYLSEIDILVFQPIEAALKSLRCNSSEGWLDDPVLLLTSFKRFNRERIKLPRKTKQPAAWLEAYKGAGAYYTLKNMIMFHNTLLPNCTDEQKSLKALEFKCELLQSGEGYKMLGLLKETIKRNGIDIKAKRQEWRESKNNN